MKNRPDLVIRPGKPRWSRTVLLRHLRKDLRNRALEAYLFGSHASGTATDMSDIDLILVTQTTARWPRRGAVFDDLLDRYGAMDLLVYTPQEWAQLRAEPTAFLEYAKKRWKRVL